MKVEGNLLKMQNEHTSPVTYKLPIGDELVDMNPLIGKKIKMTFDGVINDIVTGEQIKKSYNNGYSYKSVMTLAQCDICIVKPELCHYDKGTCREPEWGERHCMKPHIIYLANSSGLKIGITREENVPHRWIDQGATEALPIMRVENRYVSGLIESEIAKEMNDKTNWRKMLKNEVPEVDLVEKREEIFETYADLLDSMGAEDLDEEALHFEYPVEKYPEKVTSLGFDKKPVIEGTLVGIKGQYLILDIGVVNIRKHQGYYITLES